jgi:hypothetical protein
MKKAELILVLLTILAIILDLFQVPAAAPLTVVLLSSLATLYMYLGFALFNDIRLRNIFRKESYKAVRKERILGAIGAGFVLSLTIIGLLFKIQIWPGGKFNLIVGLTGLLIVSVVALSKYAKNRSPYYQRILLRVALFGSLGLAMLLIPESGWINFKYRNHPGYAAALNNALANPSNDELWDKVEAERVKMKSH